MRKKSRLEVYGVLGYPAKHSFSPAMHNAAFRALGIKAAYRLFEIRPSELEDFMATLGENNIRGMNVTIPYKEKVLDYINGYRQPAVKIIGAANTVKIDNDGRLSCFNTDFSGFMQHLAELKVRPKRVAVIGAGGAARAVCFGLAKKKVSEIALYDIDRFRSISLVERLKSVFSSGDFLAASSIEGLRIPDKDLLVNASPVGMKPDDPCLVNAGQLHPGLFVYDLIYNPGRTKLLELATSRGLANSNGLGMLLYQAVLSFSHWTGRDAPQDIMGRALQRELKKCQR
ncbi:MAG: shikimate dehydrogenase [Candidatus Omnitrophota bacterium]